MIIHSYLEKPAIGKIGIWEDDNEIIGVATFDTQPGDACCLTLPEYTCLKKEFENN